MPLHYAILASNNPNPLDGAIVELIAELPQLFSVLVKRVETHKHRTDHIIVPASPVQLIDYLLPNVMALADDPRVKRYIYRGRRTRRRPEDLFDDAAGLVKARKQIAEFISTRDIEANKEAVLVRLSSTGPAELSIISLHQMQVLADEARASAQTSKGVLDLIIDRKKGYAYYDSDAAYHAECAAANKWLAVSSLQSMMRRGPTEPTSHCGCQAVYLLATSPSGKIALLAMPEPGLPEPCFSVGDQVRLGGLVASGSLLNCVLATIRPECGTMMTSWTHVHDKSLYDTVDRWAVQIDSGESRGRVFNIRPHNLFPWYIIDADGDSALMIMCAENLVENVRALLSKGGDILEVVSCNAANKNGYTALMACVGIVDGSDEDENIECLKLLLNVSCCPTALVDLDMQDKNGRTALHHACGADMINERVARVRVGHYGCLQLLLNKGADIDIEDVDHRTALFFACIGGRIEMVRALVVECANIHGRERLVKFISGDLYQEFTPLMNLTIYGHIEPLHLLLDKGVDVEVQDRHLRTALHYACGANLVRDPGEDGGEEPTGHLDCVLALLEKNASVNKEDASQSTALHYACRVSNPEMVEALLNKGSDLHTEDICGHTPLMVACGAGDLRCVQLLLNKGADVCVVTWDDGSSKTALMEACGPSRRKFARYHSGHLDCIKALLEQGRYSELMIAEALDVARRGCHGDIVALVEASC